MDDTKPQADSIVAEVMQRWPSTVAVFVRRRMACPGCALSPFITVAEAARAYRLTTADLLVELGLSIAETG